MAITLISVEQCIEASILQNQTDEMRAKNLQLVVPRLIHSSYNAIQQSWLMNMSEFIQMAKERQGHYDHTPNPANNS